MLVGFVGTTGEPFDEMGEDGRRGDGRGEDGRGEVARGEETDIPCELIFFLADDLDGLGLRGVMAGEVGGMRALGFGAMLKNAEEGVGGDEGEEGGVAEGTSPARLFCARASAFFCFARRFWNHTSS